MFVPGRVVPAPDDATAGGVSRVSPVYAASVPRPCRHRAGSGAVSTRGAPRSVLEQAPHEMERGDGGPRPDPLPLAGQLEAEGLLAHRPGGVEEDEPDRLLRRPPAR